MSREGPLLEALSQAGLLQRMLAVRARHLAAEPRRRHHLARIRAARRVERAAQLLERLEVGLREHLRHVALLVDAHAVLPGDRAAGLHARDDDLARQLLRALGLALDALVVADERMQVPVAGVEDVADLQPVLPRERIDAIRSE